MQSVFARLTPLFAVVTLPLGILAAIFVNLPTALAVFVVGWLLLTPASAVLFGGSANPGPAHGPFEMWGDDEIEELVQERMKEAMREKTGESAEGGSTDPVEELRERYARGEIDEAELERRLDALLETEDVDADDEESIERAMGNLDTDEPGASPTDGRDDRETASESSEVVTDPE